MRAPMRKHGGRDALDCAWQIHRVRAPCHPPRAAVGSMTFAEVVQWAKAQGLTAVLPALALEDISSLQQLRALPQERLAQILAGAGRDVCLAIHEQHTKKRPAHEEAARRVAARSASSEASPPEAQGPPRLLPSASQRAPPIYAAAPRGCLSAAREAAEPAVQQDALAALRRDMYARTSSGPADSRRTTWTRLAAAWGLPPLPLTVQLVHRVGASLKRGGYRSAEQYFSTARLWHVQEHNQEVPPAVALAIRQTCRSILRGLGGPARKDAFRLEGLAAARLQFPGSTVVRDKAVADPLRMAALGCWFLCRGIELQCARTEHVSITVCPPQVSWLLPASKTDTAAAGVTRVHGCCCHGGDGALCPVHIMMQVMNSLPDRGAAPGPLFPITSGEAPSSAAIAEAIRSAASACGEQLTAPRPDGGIRQRFGEHALRVSGAQFFTRWRLALYEIQLLGRWGSSAFERYVQEAPLCRLALGMTPPRPIEPLPLPDMTAVEVRPEAQQPAASSLHKTVEALQKELSNLQASRSRECPFVVHAERGTYHIAAARPAHASSLEWKTRCGWAFTQAPYRFSDTVPEDCAPCMKCHGKPGPRAGQPRRTRAAEASSSGSDSSGSSDSSS